MSPDQESPELKRLRHDIRGKMNALMLCTAALSFGDSVAQQLGFLDDIEQATDALIALLDEVDREMG